MKIKSAFWMAPLTLSLAVGICFAQSGTANAQDSQKAEASHASSNELLVAAVQTDDTAADTVETADSEAEPQGTNPSGNNTASRANHSYSKIGIGVKMSTLGAGIEVATPIARKFNIRGGFNMFQYSRDITNNGIQYNAKLQFQSAEAHLDWFLFGPFHISPGILFYNGNQITATALVPAGNTFTLGGTTYMSDPTIGGNPVNGTGKMDFVKVSPTILIGIGNLIPRNGRHYSFLFEVGGAYQGSARVALNLAGTACDSAGLNCVPAATDPTVQANVQAQQVKIQNKIDPYRFFPIISLGVGFNF
jgi:ABC-type transport system substrate-binding protein